MSARQTMTMRCTVRRRTDISDGGGGSDAAWAPHLADVPCRAWHDARRGSEATAGSGVQVIEDRRIIVPPGIDVTETDRIGDVTDRGGTVLFSGPMEIDSVGRRPDHLILLVREVT